MAIGWKANGGGGGGAVDSIFGRTGVVTAQLADYSADLITASGPLGATQVQEALDALALTIGAVDSVFGRLGVITAMAGDYDAGQVTASGPLGATDVQGALDAIASSLALHGASHVSTGSDPIPIATTAVRGTVEFATDGEVAASLAVQANDSRLSNARTPTAHGSTHTSAGSDPIPIATTAVRGTVEFATDGEVAASLAVQANDSRLSNSRTPTAHAASHENGGSDEISVAGLSGLLADPQTPTLHGSTHISTGSDPIPIATTAVRGTVEFATDGEVAASLAVQANDTRLSNSRTPTAHAASHENGGADEISVAGLSGLLADAQTPTSHGSTHISTGSDPIPIATTAVRGTVEFATDGEVAASLAVQANDSRLSNSRPPTAHATSHENGGADEINVAGLSGLLADAQTPTTHAASHQNGGADEISVAGLSGLLADAQTPTAHGSTHTSAGSDPIPIATTAVRGTVEFATDGEVAASLAVQANDGRLSNSRAPTAHATSHQNGGADEIDVTGLSGLLADAQTPILHGSSHVSTGSDPIPIATTAVRGTVEFATDGESAASLAVQANDTRLSNSRTPTAHAASHQNGGADEISVAGLSGLLADPQTPTTHAASHENGGADEISVAGLSGLLADPQTPTAHAASHQNGGSDEINVAGLSGLLADAQTPTSHGSTHTSAGSDPIPIATTAVRGTVEFATDGESAASLAVQANDGRLSNSRTPTAHAASHQNGGADEIDVAGLSGLLADAQTPTLHGSTHISTGSDPIPIATTAVRGTVEFATDGESAASLAVQANDTRLSNARAPTAHATSHQNGGADEISVAGLSGLLADAQTPLGHAASHEDGGADEITIEALATAEVVNTTFVLNPDGAGGVVWAAQTGGGAPADAEYLVAAAYAGLSDERVVADTPTIAWDFGTPGAAEADVVDGSITFAKMQDIATDRLLGRDTAATGDVEEISVGGGLEFTGAAAIQRSALTGDVTAAAGSGTTALRNSAALSVIGRSANSVGAPADIAATPASDAVLRESGSTIGFGTVATGGLADNSVTNGKLRDSVALSVIGRNVNSGGDPLDISVAAGSGLVLRESGNVLGFGQINTTGIADAAVQPAQMANMAQNTFLGRATASTGVPETISIGGGLEFSGFTLRRQALTGDVTASAGSNATTIAGDAVTNSKLANMATATVKGRVTAGTGDPEDLTSAQLTTLIALFTDLLAGAVPASGGGTTNFLRADGTWTAPSGGSGLTSPQVMARAFGGC